MLMLIYNPPWDIIGTLCLLRYRAGIIVVRFRAVGMGRIVLYVRLLYDGFSYFSSVAGAG